MAFNIYCFDISFSVVFLSSSYEKPILSSIAINLLSSILFAIIFGYLANESLLKIFKEENKVQSDLMAQKIINNLQNINTNYTPSSLYFPTKEIDIKFNKELSLDLKSSTFYLFRGVSAKYVPIRIRNTSNNLSYVKIIILDPLDDVSLTIRARDRKKNPKHSKKSIVDIKEGIRMEIYKCIVDLFDVRMKCPIDVCFVNETSVYRLEIFDSALFLSLYHTPNTINNSFPETFRYSKNSTYYNMFRLDSFRKIEELSKNKFRFSVRNSENDLISQLQKVGFLDASPEKIKEIRIANKKFENKFVNSSRIKTY